MTTFEILLFLLLAASTGYVWWLLVRLRQAEARRAQEQQSERARQEALIHAQNARIDAILDGMVEGLIVLDAGGLIARVNRAAETMFRFSRMMVGGTLLEAVRNHEVAALAAQAAGSPEAIAHEIRLEVPLLRILQISAAALRDPQGRPAGVVLVFHDVTQLRVLEAMRQDFVANVSHELRTPLSLIRSAAETLVDGGMAQPAIATRFLEIIEKQANRLTLLIDDLLLLARLDSGRVELNRRPLPLWEAAQEAVDDAALVARGRGVTLVNEAPDDVVVDADPDRLRQVLTNLVDNAIKYGRADGRVVIGGRRAGADRVEVWVSDDGPGIPEAALPRLFERFYRVDKARSREQGGTGLGLAIVKNVVQAHGGDVRVDSRLGLGTTFTLSLPGPGAGQERVTERPA